MGKQISIDLEFAKECNLKILLDELFLLGWSCNHDGFLTFLDNDEFEWMTTSLDCVDTVIDILNNRVLQDEICAIVLVHKDMQSGGEFLFHSKNELSIMLNINRFKIGITDRIDFSVYLSHINSIIEKYCDSYRCEEIL